MAAVQSRIAASIYIIDPRPIGGMVFGTSDDEIMCNTPVDVTSIDGVRPDDLLDYLRRVGRIADHSSYIPRRVVGDYIRYNFSKYLDEARRLGIGVFTINSSCSSISILSPRNYELAITGPTMWGSLSVTDIILCTGHGSPKIPHIFEPFADYPTFFKSPYPEAEMLAKMPARSEVLIIGSKQSAMDAALLLCREGHRVTMLSPSGELPSVRTRFSPSLKFPIEQHDLREIMSLWNLNRSALDIGRVRLKYLRFLIKELKKLSRIPASQQFAKATSIEERLREEIQIAEKGECTWQDLVLSFVEAANIIYFSRTESYTYGFEPDFQRRMMRYVAAAALPNAKRILKHIESGAVAVKKGNATNVHAPNMVDKVWKVEWEHGAGCFDAVVCATGFQNHQYHFDDTGTLVLGNKRAGQADVIDIAHDLSIRNPKTNEQENIWITGSGTHGRILTSSGVALSIPQVMTAISGMKGAGFKVEFRRYA